MKRLQKIMAATFILGLISLLLYTFGLLSWNCLGIGFYWYEANLLLAWTFIMFGTAMFYGLLMAILYPEQVKKRFTEGKWHHF